MEKPIRKIRTAFKVHIAIFVLLIIFRAIIFMAVEPRPEWLDIVRVSYIVYFLGILLFVDKYEEEEVVE